MVIKDVIDSLIKKEITLTEAYDFYDQIIDSDSAHAMQQMGLNKYEWTAFCQAAPLETLASWRAEGWPRTCLRCHKEIEVQAFGWFVIEENQKHFLVHINCLP